ncbi:MAG: hypothetical protein ACX98W_22395, partial [bacterium]
MEGAIRDADDERSTERSTGPIGGWTRRGFLSAAMAAVAGGGGLLGARPANAQPGSVRPARARSSLARAGIHSELDATASEGIDLVLERQPLLV